LSPRIAASVLRGDKVFYRARRKSLRACIRSMPAPAEHFAGWAFLSLVDPGTYESDASRCHVAPTFSLPRDLFCKRALPKLEAVRYIARKSGTIAFDLLKRQFNAKPRGGPPMVRKR